MGTDSESSDLVAARQKDALEAVEQLLADEGADVTMAQMAAAAGVGRRTLFRYFGSREALITAAIRQSYDRLRTTVFTAGVETPASADELIIEVLTATHRVAAKMGRAHWQIAADPEAHGPLGLASAERRRARTEYVNEFGDRLWEMAGGTGRPPQWLVDTFGLVESLFAYQALKRDFGRGDAEIIETAATIMRAALAHALQSDTASS